MKYKIQCPYCGNDELEYKVNTEEFYCNECDDLFETELIGIREIEEDN